MKDGGAWGLLLLLAIMLIVAGFQGSLGKLIGVVFTPNMLQVV